MAHLLDILGYPKIQTAVQVLSYEYRFNYNTKLIHVLDFITRRTSPPREFKSQHLRPHLDPQN
jgi:hypothetical protein